MKRWSVTHRTMIGMALVLAWCIAGLAHGGEVGDEDRRPRGDLRPGMGPGRGQWLRGERMGGAATRPVSSEDIARIKAFMQRHSPRRFERFEELPPDRQAGLMPFLALRFQMLEELKQNDPEVYDLRLGRMTIEDEIFDLGWQLNHAAPENNEELRKKLEKQVRAQVKSWIEERRIRLRQWKKRAEEESAMIQNHEANIDRIVKANLNDIENNQWPGMMNMLGPMGPGMGPMGSGMGPGPGRGGMRRDGDRPPPFAPTTLPVEPPG